MYFDGLLNSYIPEWWFYKFEGRYILHLSPFGHELRAWSLSSSGLFTVKSFFLVLSNHIDPTSSFPIDFVWKF